MLGQKLRSALVHAFRASCILAALSCMLSGCAPRPQAREPRASWFVLENGRFVEVPVERIAASDVPAVPWTVQERVAGFTRFAGSVYAAVNAWGVVRIDPGAESPFTYYYDRGLFRGRTFGAFLGDQDGLLCHVYRDLTLAQEAAAETMEAGTVNLLRLRPGSRGHEVDFVRADPPGGGESGAPWQAVSAARDAGGRIWLEWKRADGGHVVFAYTVFDPASGLSRAVSREDYRAALGMVLLDEPGAPAVEGSLGRLLARIVERTPRDAYLHVVARSGPVARHFVRLPQGGNGPTREVSLWTEGDRVFALEPEGVLLWSEARESSVRESALPPLPPGLRYCELAVQGDIVLASWEQADFYRVARAGLLLVREAFPEAGKP